MELLIIEIYDDVFYWSNNSKQEDILYRGIFETSSFSSVKQAEFRDTLLRLKGDWLSVSSDSFSNFHFIKISLLALEEAPSNEKRYEDLLIKIIEYIKRSFKEVNFDMSQIKPINEEENFGQGHFVTIEDIYEYDFIDEMEKALLQHNVKYKIINHKRTSTESGAGDYREQILLWISGAIMSGLTWDVIKNSFFKNLSIHEHKQLDLDVVLEEVAEKLGESKCHFHVKNISEQDNQLHLTINTNYRIINVVCDNDSNIVEIVTNNTSQTRI